MPRIMIVGLVVLGALACERPLTGPPAEGTAVPRFVQGADASLFPGRFTAVIAPSAAEAALLQSLAPMYTGVEGNRVMQALAHPVEIDPMSGRLTITFVQEPVASPAFTAIAALRSERVRNARLRERLVRASDQAIRGLAHP